MNCYGFRATPALFDVVSGAVLLTEGGEHHAVESIKYHEKYSPNTLDNDVAVLKVSKKVLFYKTLISR